jgi:hypothetical protein
VPTPIVNCDVDPRVVAANPEDIVPLRSTSSAVIRRSWLVDERAFPVATVIVEVPAYNRVSQFFVVTDSDNITPALACTVMPLLKEDAVVANVTARLGFVAINVSLPMASLDASWMPFTRIVVVDELPTVTPAFDVIRPTSASVR